MYPFGIFLSVTLLFLSWVGIFHSVVPFNAYEYRYNANHFTSDPRIHGKQFSLISALGQYDSQWYLKIAANGYPDHPNSPLKETTKAMDGLMYNFFPLYPLLIAAANIFIKHIEMSGFVVSNLLLLASCWSIYFVVSKWFSKQIAMKTLLLFLLYPFSVFLHGYYAEDMRLLLFIWFCYALTKKKFFLGSLIVGLLTITSGISIFLLPFYYAVLGYFVKKKENYRLQ